MENCENSAEVTPVLTLNMAEEASTVETNVPLCKNGSVPHTRYVRTVTNKAKPKLNLSAKPFVPKQKILEHSKQQPSVQIVNSISSSADTNERGLPASNKNESVNGMKKDPMKQLFQSEQNHQIVPSLPMFLNPSNMSSYFNYLPGFAENHPRNLVFNRIFGPVPNLDGTIEVRLHHGIRVLVSLDHSILLLNPRSQLRIAISGDLKISVMEHPNGKVYQQPDRVDIVAYDGSHRNNFIRFAKMWHKGVSLTASGLALIYLVDNGGTRTTSDQVNRNIRSSIDIFYQFPCVRRELYEYAATAVNDCKYAKDSENTEVFEIHGCQITQTCEGFVRVTRNNDQKYCLIRTNPINGSAALSIEKSFHCTASLGNSSHLFVRRNESRVHFDGVVFSVRNSGHSANFDEHNFLCVA